MLIVLPLAFSCKSGHTNNHITEDYRHIIVKQLKHVVSMTYELLSDV